MDGQPDETELESEVGKAGAASAGETYDVSCFGLRLSRSSLEPDTVLDLRSWPVSLESSSPGYVGQGAGDEAIPGCDIANGKALEKSLSMGQPASTTFSSLFIRLPTNQAQSGEMATTLPSYANTCLQLVFVLLSTWSSLSPSLSTTQSTNL